MDRQIFVFSIIDTYSAETIIRQLLNFDRKSDEEITMFINSPGGSVVQMLAIIDAMNMVKSPIRTVVVGIAASAASVIAMCGDKRYISKTGQFMLHQASGVSYGEVSDMKDQVAQAEKLQNMMFEIMARKSGKTTQAIEELIDRKDKYFDARESVSMGFVDSIIQDGEAQVLKFSEGINVEGYEIKSGKNPEIQLLREGKYLHPIYGQMVITEQNLQVMKANFDNNVRGCDVSIDYTHENEDGESPAAFWIKSLEIKGNSDGNGKGLFARGEFTPRGETLVAQKEYKYSSADFVIDYVDQSGNHHPYVLRGGTLTNRPFIKNMNPIKLSELENNKKERTVMTLEQLQAALKEQGVDVLAITGERDALKARIGELEAKISQFNSLPAEKEEEIKALKDQLASANQQIVDAEKLSAFNDLVSQGKVVPAQKEDILSAFDNADRIKSFYAKAPTVVNLKKVGDGHEETLEELTAEEQVLVDSGEYTKEQIIEGRSPVAKKK